MFGVMQTTVRKYAHSTKSSLTTITTFNTEPSCKYNNMLLQRQPAISVFLGFLVRPFWKCNEKGTSSGWSASSCVTICFSPIGPLTGKGCGLGSTRAVALSFASWEIRAIPHGLELLGVVSNANFCQ